MKTKRLKTKRNNNTWFLKIFTINCIELLQYNKFKHTRPPKLGKMWINNDIFPQEAFVVNVLNNPWKVSKQSSYPFPNYKPLILNKNFKQKLQHQNSSDIIISPHSQKLGTSRTSLRPVCTVPSHFLSTVRIPSKETLGWCDWDFNRLYRF